MLGIHVPVHYVSNLALHVRPAYLHLTIRCYVADCLRGIFVQPASGVLPGVVDPGLNRSCAECLFLYVCIYICMRSAQLCSYIQLYKVELQQ